MKKMQNHGGDIYRNKTVIDFSSNVNPFGPPANVINQLKENIGKISNYPDQECEELTNKLSDKLNIWPEWISFGNGAAELIFTLVLSIRPEKVLTPVPGFLEYERGIQAIGAKMISYPLKEENGFCMQEDFLEKIDSMEKSGMVILCNPNNPTGTIICPKLLRKIAKKCKENHVILLIDECFQEFLEEEKMDSMIRELKDNPYLVILKAFTKQYALPGVRLGYLLSSNRKIHEKIRKVTQPWNVSTLAQIAGIQALDEEIYWKKSFDDIQKEKLYLLEELEKTELKIYGSHANYIFFYSGKNLYQELLKKNILIRNCENYQGLDSGYYRIAVKTRDENKQLINKLIEVMERGD